MYAELDIMTRMKKEAPSIDLAEQVRKAFSRSGLSRFELAKRAKTSYSVVHRFIGGDRDVRSETLSRLADVLDLELRPRRKRK